MAKNGITRRHFFFGTVLAGMMPAGGWGSVPSLKLLGYRSPNEKLNIACIGAGGRASADINGVSAENLVAFADPDSVRAAEIFNKYSSAPKYTDFRQLFDKEEKNIDAVTIAIPDHMHATAAMWAMERGKHVYCEKPLTHTPWEARMLTEAAARYGVATQMGNQGYSNDGTRIAAEIIWSGAIGNVTEVHAWTNRPIWPQGMDEVPPPDPVPATLDWDTWLGVAEDRPYTSGGPAYHQEYHTEFGFYQPFNWRGFLDFGCGSIGDMACHILGAPNMALMLGSPTSVELVKQDGRNSLTFPKTTVTRFEFPARGNMPPVTIYWYDGETGPAYWPQDVPKTEPLIGGPGSFGSTVGDGTGAVNDAARASASYNGSDETPAPLVVKPDTGDNGALFVGDKGYLTTDTYAARVRLLPEERNNDFKLPNEIIPRSPGHWRDWIRACKGGQPACSNFSIAGPFAEWILLATIATRFDGKLEWDPDKMRFSNNDDATKYIRPNFRKSWAQVWNGKKLNAA